MVECPRCGTKFDRDYVGEGLVTDGPLRLEWDRRYDRRLRAWSVGSQILPAGAPMSVFAIRMCVHECEPDWPDDVRFDDDDSDDVL